MADGYYLCVAAPENPPPVSHANETYILHVTFHSSGKNDYKVDYERLQTNLLTELLRERFGDNYHELLMRLTFHDFTPKKDMHTFCQKELKRGIFCRQGPYNFLGHSEADLRRHSCYLMKASHEEIHDLLGQFDDILGQRDVRRRARKISVLFSPLNESLQLNPEEYRIEPDRRVRRFFRSYTSTNRCGFMSPTFSTQVQEALHIDYQPSVVHVRYRGIEGLLVFKENLQHEKIQFHESMQKFKTRDAENMPKSLNLVDVVDYSRPYENGYLDAQMILMLLELGIPGKNFEELQLRYYELLDGMCREAAELFLGLKGEFDLIREIKQKRISDAEIQNCLKTFWRQELNNMTKAARQTRILVPNSRVVFAVCDPHNKLKPGECYFKPTMPEDEEKNFPGAKRKVVVMRKPSYHPGDVQLLKLTDDTRGYENLRDCLVLPAIGPRPCAFEYAEGTAGANKFFVSWSVALHPKVTRKPCIYPARKAAATISKPLEYITSKIRRSSRSNPRQRIVEDRKEMVKYFANFTDDLTGRIDEVYMEHATLFGPTSNQCRKLSKLFFQAVNLTEDRVVLVKELSKIKDQVNHARASGDSHLLTFREAVRERAVRQYVQQLRRRPRNLGHQTLEKMEKKAKKFLEHPQRDLQMSTD